MIFHFYIYAYEYKILELAALYLCSSVVLTLLLHEFFFSLVFETQPRIGFYRVPTHRRVPHRKFIFIIPSYFKIEILNLPYTIVTEMQQKVNHNSSDCATENSN